jgi:hypothetical protein
MPKAVPSRSGQPHAATSGHLPRRSGRLVSRRRDRLERARKHGKSSPKCGLMQKENCRVRLETSSYTTTAQQSSRRWPTASQSLSRFYKSTQTLSRPCSVPSSTPPAERCRDATRSYGSTMSPTETKRAPSSWRASMSARRSTGLSLKHLRRSMAPISRSTEWAMSCRGGCRPLRPIQPSWAFSRTSGKRQHAHTG